MQGFLLRARIFFFVSCGGYTISLLWLTLSRKFTGSLQYFNIHCRVNSQLSLTVFSCKKGVMPDRLVKIPKVKIKPHNFIRRHVHPIHTSSHIFFDISKPFISLIYFQALGNRPPKIMITLPLIRGDIWLLSRYDISSSEMKVDLIPGGLKCVELTPSP